MSAPFRLSSNLSFLCSDELYHYLRNTAFSNRMKLSALCRTGLAEFSKRPKSFATRDIGARILKNYPPLDRFVTVNISMPLTHKSKGQENKTLRDWLFDYAAAHNLTLATVLRRAAYEYALKLNRTTDPLHDEDPQLLVDAWVHIDGRGSYRVQMAEEAKRAATDRTIKAVTKEDFKEIQVPWMRNPERFSAMRELPELNPNTVPSTTPNFSNTKD